MSRLSLFKEQFGSDPRAASLIHGVEVSAYRLRETVVNLYRTLQQQEHRLDTEELVALTRRLADREHSAHTALVDSVVALNRYLFKTYGGNVPPGGVVEADPMALKSDFRGTCKNWVMQLEEVAYA